jgi:hypothetical protein
MVVYLSERSKHSTHAGTGRSGKLTEREREREVSEIARYLVVVVMDRGRSEDFFGYRE